MSKPEEDRTMKRFSVFMLAVLILFTCSACKKETLPAMQSGSAQTAAGETEQIVSGVSVRVPAVQYHSEKGYTKSSPLKAGYWCLKEHPAHISIQSNTRLSLLTSTCCVVCLLPQAYSNRF